MRISELIKYVHSYSMFSAYRLSLLIANKGIGLYFLYTRMHGLNVVTLRKVKNMSEKKTLFKCTDFLRFFLSPYLFYRVQKISLHIVIYLDTMVVGLLLVVGTI